MNRDLNDIIIDGYLKIVNINGQILMCFEGGKIYRINNSGIQFIKNTANCNNYNGIGCRNIIVPRHRIIAYAF